MAKVQKHPGGMSTYKIKDWKDEPIEGQFYREEIQPVPRPEFFRVEKILKTVPDPSRGPGARKYLVKWLGYKEPTWTTQDPRAVREI